ncbi:hypothetical protein KIN20_037233 [Parelaphostrongylus tenuis]|uniref:Uncharacterized protein n=1 Tax=Parelaphostrongylus tenuis TaxID=148309 RepID=A0AAD5RDN6_PARTN|nr:hypothetical protein KIN20_021078 [Parelaphostrongylus tenuis]KAJ1374530.1 hypothetical protein KIN20_037233 [Parelaphostrongylus tenuis]
MVYAANPALTSQVSCMAFDKTAAQRFVQRLVMQTLLYIPLTYCIVFNARGYGLKGAEE